MPADRLSDETLRAIYEYERPHSLLGDCRRVIEELRRERQRSYIPPLPDMLRVWAEWFDNPNHSPAIVLDPKPRRFTPGMVLREIADKMEASGGDDE